MATRTPNGFAPAQQIDIHAGGTANFPPQISQAPAPIQSVLEKCAGQVFAIHHSLDRIAGRKNPAVVPINTEPGVAPGVEQLAHLLNGELAEIGNRLADLEARLGFL